MLVSDHLPIVQPELQSCRVEFAAHGQETRLAVGKVFPIDEEASVGAAPVRTVDVEATCLGISDHVVGGFLGDFCVQNGLHQLGRPACPDTVNRGVR